MSPYFLVKILCYSERPFTITLTSSAIICAGRCPEYFRIRQRPTQIIADDANVMVKGLYV